MEIKFAGDYKGLKPMGYRFLKLYGDNRICYRKEDVWIWRRDKYIEINDLDADYSGLVFKYLIDNNFTLNNKFNIIMINNETKSVEDYDSKKHEDLFLFMQFNDSEIDEELRKFRDKYRKTRLTNETIECLKELYEKQLVVLEGDE
ncbi:MULTISPECIES: hypothetical protein [Bacillus cereus group]|uniref:Uncharacterized protein n=1 Tax=Bacillus thuringiensis TaxID=1428 RepID=A0A9X6WHF6_BACTU|nr:MULTISPECIES: hypothetical protein [Bacillus cereus group]PFJ27134.1 hypothetical protein COJ15_34455 [Bacillus thuringiensis]PGP21010.1 hypothetical protein COA01_15845 [Bacillus cereus]